MPKELRTVSIFVVNLLFYGARPPMSKVLRTIFLSSICLFIETCVLIKSNRLLIFQLSIRLLFL